MTRSILSIVVEGKLPTPLSQGDLIKIGSAIVDTVLVKNSAEVGLKFVSTAESRRLNKQYSGNDYATDVLAFEYDSNDTESLGDIVVCASQAKEQAERYGVDVKSELVLLIVHGILHLLQYDHQSEQDTASMDWLQGAIMKLLKYEYRNFQWSH